MGRSSRVKMIDRVLMVVILGLCMVVAGAAGAWALLWEDPPDLLARPVAPDTVAVPVTQRQFDDAQLVVLSLNFGPELSLFATRAGILTASTCAIGEKAVSGQSLVAISGAPIISLATTVPLWRDITVGDSGMDVQAIARELARLGWFDGDINRSVGWDLIRAFKQLALELGTPEVALPDGVIPVGNVAWLPHDAIRIASCPTSIGAPVTPGQALARFDTSIVSAKVITDVTRFTPGVRTLTIGDQTIVVNVDGLITDSETLAILAASPMVAFAVASGSQDSIQATYRLAEPLTVSVVPPAAIRPVTTGLGCVIGDGRIMAVTIVSSELGQSFVTFPGLTPREVTLNPPEDLTCT